VSGLGAFRRGLAAARAGWRLVGLVWAADLCVAAAAALPYLVGLDALTAGRPDAGALAARFDARLFTDFVARHRDLYATADLRVLLTTALAVFVHAVLAGGLFEVLGRRGAAGEPPPGAVRGFFAACAAHAGRMLAVSLIAALLLGAAAWLLHGVLADGLEETIRESAREPTRFVFKLLPGALFLLVLALVGLVADAWRACVVMGEAPLGRALLRTGELLRRRLGAFVAVGLGGLALQAAGLAVFVSLDGAIPQGRWPAIVTVILLGQALMLWRTGLRAAVLAAQARLCRDELAAAAPLREEGPVLPSLRRRSAG
jgi:hypothetical protein